MHTLQEWQVWYQSANVTGFEEPLLEAWDNRLAAQNVHFDMCVAKHMGSGHVAGEKNVTFLRIDQGLAKPAIEKAVAAFIRDRRWPRLDRRIPAIGT